MKELSDSDDNKMIGMLFPVITLETGWTIQTSTWAYSNNESYHSMVFALSEMTGETHIFFSSNKKKMREHMKILINLHGSEDLREALSKPKKSRKKS